MWWGWEDELGGDFASRVGVLVVVVVVGWSGVVYVSMCESGGWGVYTWNILYIVSCWVFHTAVLCACLACLFRRSRARL